MAKIKIAELPIDVSLDVSEDSLGQLTPENSMAIRGGMDIIYVDECEKEIARVVIPGPDTIVKAVD
jgi:hypothetical protein